MDVNDTIKIKMCLPLNVAEGNWHAEKPVGAAEYYDLTETVQCDLEQCHYEWTIDAIETTYELKADIDTCLVFNAPNGDELEMKLNIRAPEHAFYECDKEETVAICDYYLDLLGDLESEEKPSVDKCQTRMTHDGEQQYFLSILMKPDDAVVTQAVFEMPEDEYVLMCVAGDQCINKPWNLHALC